MKDSLKILKQRFPDFLDKSENSNISKFLDISNKHLQALRQEADRISYVNKLYRPILIKREQVDPNEVHRTIFANIENIKEIILYQNRGDPKNKDDFIEHSKWTYSYEDHKEEFEATHIEFLSTLENEPHYKATVETYDELFYVAEDGVYDKSIDTLGKLFDCPRFEFKNVEDVAYDDLPYTYPPYNIDEKEPDYYYLARLDEYISLMEGMPSVCLYLWKKYFIDSELVNRCKYLIKMDNKEYAYSLYAKRPVLVVDTLFPLLGQKVTATTYFLDDNLDKVSYKNGIYLSSNKEGPYYFKSRDTYSFFMESASERYLLSMFYPYDEDQQPELRPDDLERYDDKISKILTIKPRDFLSADYYVSVDGDDNNDGHTVDTALRTIERAVSLLKGDELIFLLSGEHTLSRSIIMYKDCVICGNSSEDTIIDMEDTDFYILATSTSTRFGLKDLTLIHEDQTCTYDEYVEYINDGDTQMSIFQN